MLEDYGVAVAKPGGTKHRLNKKLVTAACDPEKLRAALGQVFEYDISIDLADYPTLEAQVYAAVRYLSRAGEIALGAILQAFVGSEPKGAPKVLIKLVADLFVAAALADDALGDRVALEVQGLRGVPVGATIEERRFAGRSVRLLFAAPRAPPRLLLGAAPRRAAAARRSPPHASSSSARPVLAQTGGKVCC